MLSKGVWQTIEGLQDPDLKRLAMCLPGTSRSLSDVRLAAGALLSFAAFLRYDELNNLGYIVFRQGEPQQLPMQAYQIGSLRDMVGGVQKLLKMAMLRTLCLLSCRYQREP